ncbi:MAG TPA: tetratricopeptide repeat protein [Rhodanobacteraceae bacterium]|nr:tetratricopeptide repeat protein [Rhodanobacteraceae bacterium]
MASGKPDFFEELKRRHVWRMVIGYAVTGWLVVQIATQVFPFFNIPGSDVRLVVVLVLIGFPIALALAWVYEITPEGVRLTRAADSPDARPEHEIRQIGRRLNTIIVAVLIVAVALMGWRLLALKRAKNAPASKPIAAAQAQPADRAVAKSTAAKPASSAAAMSAFNPPADTLVVLPFANLGGDPKQQYFSDGITEELTNALGQNSALRVIAWDTASKYRDSKQSATDIAKALDVANVLTGKILRQGNEIRVIVELVNARTGYQAWSHHYDDSLSNIFQVQDKITASISDALKVKFATTNTQRTVNPKAYDLVQQARALVHTGLATFSYLEQARTLLQQAIALEPDYADAHGLLARTWSDLIGSPTLSMGDGLAKVRAEADKALSLDPRNVDALIALGNAEAAQRNDAKARTEYERALAIDPSNAGAHSDYGNMLPYKQGLAQYLKAVQLDPANVNAQNNVALIYMDLGKYRQELAYSKALVRLAPRSVAAALGLAQNYALLHQNEDAVKAFDKVQPDTGLGKAMVAAGRLAYQSLLDPKQRGRALAAADALYQRHDLDPFAQGDLMQIYLVLGKKGPALDLLATFCKPQPYSCADFPNNPTYDPLRGDPRFKALEKKYNFNLQLPASATSS